MHMVSETCDWNIVKTVLYATGFKFKLSEYSFIDLWDFVLRELVIFLKTPKEFAYRNEDVLLYITIHTSSSVEWNDQDIVVNW